MVYIMVEARDFYLPVEGPNFDFFPVESDCGEDVQTEVKCHQKKQKGQENFPRAASETGWNLQNCSPKSARFRRRPLQRLEAGKVFGSGEDFLGVGEEGFFKCWRVGDGRVEGSDAEDRTVEVVEGFFEEDGGDFSGDASGFGVFVDDEAFVGFADGLKNGFLV